MTWDLRAHYAFDATEGQIPEGQVSTYGPANSHANCVPASFTAALGLVGLPDIDPQRITNEVFGPNYRGGFGDFSRAIAWIKANVAGAPRFTDDPFDFAVADAAGAAGKLVIIAGWINPASVTFTPPGSGFSHASLLVAHLANDTFVIWNTWTGQLQTYSRATLAASLYEMAVVTQGDEMSARSDELILALTSQFVDIRETPGPPPLATELTAIKTGQDASTKAIVAAINGLVIPAPVIDTTALAAAIVAAMPSNKPPVAPQAVKDWWAAITKWLGLA